ncbi:MAG: HAMP domain-containing sensor histidine kinase, partial [Thermoanaerobaculia bacterium]
MTVAGKLATGFSLLIALLLAVVLYDLALVHRLAASHHSLSEINFRATTTALDAIRHLNQLDEFTRKLVVTRDPAYAERLEELHIGFESHLQELRSLGLSRAEGNAVASLSKLWTEYSEVAEFQRVLASETDPELVSDLGDLLEMRLNLVAEQATRVVDTAQASVSAQVSRSLDASRAARRLSWAGVALTITLSFPIFWITMRSIREPLRRLSAGTKAIGTGDFIYHLDAPGNDEFSHLARSFNQMVHRLSELDRLKRDFVSQVSHELKTPLVAMQETNSLLLDELPGNLNDKQRRLLHLNQQSARRLSAMISKLLDLARLEVGAVGYDFRSHDLAQLVRKAVAELQIRERGPAPRVEVLAPTEPILVRCDADRLFQVVDNLVENAVKYSPTDSTVSLHIGAVVRGKSPRERPATRAVVEVRDSGPGVPDEDKERIFEKFYQINPGPQGNG